MCLFLIRCIQFSRTSRLHIERPDKHPVFMRLEPAMFPAYAFLYVAFARVSLFPPFCESKSLSRSSWVPQGHHPKHSRVLPLFSVSRILQAALHLAIFLECHLHATFPLTCINIYSDFPAASRILPEIVTFITFDFFHISRM